MKSEVEISAQFIRSNWRLYVFFSIKYQFLLSLQQGHKKTFSDLYASCGIIFDNGSSFKSFLESNHTAAAYKLLMNRSPSVVMSYFCRLGPTFSPNNYRRILKSMVLPFGKNESYLWQMFINLVKSKVCWKSIGTESANVLRASSRVRGTADHFLVATWFLLQDL